MPQENEHGHGEQGFEVMINGTTFAVHDTSVSFEEIINLVYPGGLEDPKNIFKVDFENAVSNPNDGSLVKGGHTEVRKRGTEFSVVRSVRS